MKVTLITTIDTEETFEFSARIQARKVIRAVLVAEHCPVDAEVSFTLCGDETIQEMNRDYRGIDKVTDVLSFPNLVFDEPSDFAMISEDPYSCMDPETGRVFLGDIVLNARRVKEQAQMYGHSVLREFSFLIAHSALHLCGYDHMTPDEAEIMENRQREILDRMGITRDLTDTAVVPGVDGDEIIVGVH